MSTRNVVVTGSASGIGAACAALFADRGDRVIGVDLHDCDIVADLSSPAGRELALAGVGHALDGPLDVLVPCAGLAGWPGRTGSLLVSVNYFGTIDLLEGLRPLLAGSSSAAVVVISSNSTTVQPDVPMTVVEACLAHDEGVARARADEVGSLRAYPASKLALARWVRRHAPSADWVGAGIRLNAVAPGMIDTPMVAEGRADRTVGPLLDLLPIPVGRPGRADEMAELIAFLTGPRAGYFCGSVVFADGGSDAVLRPDDFPTPWVLGPSTPPSEVPAQ